MPIHLDDLMNDEPFPIKPDTNEYEALSFLVVHREYGFTELRRECPSLKERPPGASREGMNRRTPVQTIT